MKEFNIKRLISTCFAFAILVTSSSVPASAETWRFGSMMPADSAEGRGYAKFSELVNKYTDGEVKLQVYPSSQLGKMNAMVEALSSNIIQVVGSGASFLSKWVPDMKYMAAPFLFKNQAHWNRFMETDLVKGWFQKVEKDAGIMILGSLPAFPRGTYRVLVSKTPVKTLNDIKGLKVRQYRNQLVVEAWQCLGAEVRVMGWNEVYDGLNRKIIEAVTSPAQLVENMRFYEVAPYIVRTDEYPQAIAFMVNKSAFDKLSPKNQAALNRAHAEAAAFEVKILEDELSESLKRITEQGAKYSEDLDIRAIREKERTFYKEQDRKGKLPKGFFAEVEATLNP